MNKEKGETSKRKKRNEWTGAQKADKRGRKNEKDFGGGERYERFS